jgi:hypothetical protein
MILILEVDARPRDGRRFTWRPAWFRASWHGERTWRIMWGIWSASYYPEPGLRDFFDYAQNETEWRT